MAKTYCGKACDTCQEKLASRCEGCTDGPGSRFGGDCPIAICCRQKSHESCETCQQMERCGRLEQKEQMPEIRKQAAETREAQESLKKNRAVVLGKWLWILFWLIIPSTIAGFLGNENIVGSTSSLYFFGSALSVVVGILYGVILLRLRDVENKYRLAGIFSIITIVLAIVLELIPVENPALVLLIGLPAIILGLVAKYYEFYGHAAVLEDFDAEFSQKWLTLWKWNWITAVGLVVSVLLTLFMILLGVLLILVCAFATFIIAIMQLVYLYKMAKLFRKYA